MSYVYIRPNFQAKKYLSKRRHELSELDWRPILAPVSISKFLEGIMALHHSKTSVPLCGMFLLPICYLIAFAAPMSAQIADPAKARMQEMDRRELQLNGPGAD